MAKDVNRIQSHGAGQGPRAVSSEHDSEPPGCIKGGKFLAARLLASQKTILLHGNSQNNSGKP
jgi:hypothetical protein